MGGSAADDDPVEKASSGRWDTPGSAGARTCGFGRVIRPQQPLSPHHSAPQGLCNRTLPAFLRKIVTIQTDGYYYQPVSDEETRTQRNKRACLRLERKRITGARKNFSPTPDLMPLSPPRSMNSRTGHLSPLLTPPVKRADVLRVQEENQTGQQASHNTGMW